MNLLRSRRALLYMVASLACTGAWAQIAISSTAGAVPNPHAMLDLQGTGRGFLAPRVAAANRPTGTAAGLIIFQTDSTAAGPIGYYYYDALATPFVGWRHVSGESAWTLGGNAGTNPAVNFIGTTNSQPVRFVTNNTERMRLYATGRLSVNPVLTTPTELVEVGGGLRIGNTATTTDAGAMRFNPTTQRFEGNVSNGATTGWVEMDNTFRTRDNQPYIPPNAAPCNYVGSTNVALWPRLDNPAFGNVSIGNTTESPYSTLWEDGRHQYLYLASDLAAQSVCPNQPITGAGFLLTGGGYPTAGFYEVSMKNTLATNVPNFDLSGLSLCYGPTTYTMPGTGNWTKHDFTNSFLWAGAPYNLLVEVCHDNQDWTGGWSVQGDNTNFQADFGLFCDACGIQFPSSLCYFTVCPTSPPGTPSPTGTSGCVGWGHTGGCSLTTANQLWTCDGTFQWQGAFAGGTTRPWLAINAKIQGGAGGLAYGQYLYSENGIMVGSAAWAAAGAPLAQNFKGPGTISAEKSVFGGSTLLSDHVFDSYYDHTIRPEDAQAAMGYAHYPIEEMGKYVQRERHLPTIAGREQWEKNGRFSVDQLTTQLWVTVEDQSLYIKELNERMDALQQFLVEKRLKELKEQQATPLKKN